MSSKFVAISNSHIYMWLNKYQTKNKLRYFCNYLITTSGNVATKESRNYKLLCKFEVTSESWPYSRTQYVNRGFATVRIVMCYIKQMVQQTDLTWGYIHIPLSKHQDCKDVLMQLYLSMYHHIFFVKNGDLFSFNSEIHNLHTRFTNNLHLPSTNLTMVQKGVLYSGSKIFNYLPLQIKNHSGDLKSFKRKLKNFLIDHTLYSLDESYHLTSYDRCF